MSVLSVEALSVDFRSGDAVVSALRNVSLEVGDGEILGLAGESGCGKSTLAYAIMGLLPSSAAVSGSARFEEQDLLRLDDASLTRLRGRRIGMVFQDPTAALDPCFSIGDQVAESIRVHGEASAAAARARAVALLDEVGIPAPKERYGDPPHRLSGGQRQRVVVAAALANDPALLLADEPTTALDVTVQAQVLALLLQLRERHGTAIILITHDLGVVAETCDRVAVLYAGQLTEVAAVEALFTKPRHPYTRALLDALPGVHRERGSLRVLEGSVPDLASPPPGCRFNPRCPLAMAVCSRKEPPLTCLPGGHQVWCWHVHAEVADANGDAGSPPADMETGRKPDASAESSP